MIRKSKMFYFGGVFDRDTKKKCYCFLASNKESWSAEKQRGTTA